MELRRINFSFKDVNEKKTNVFKVTVSKHVRKGLTFEIQTVKFLNAEDSVTIPDCVFQKISDMCNNLDKAIARPLSSNDEIIAFIKKQPMIQTTAIDTKKNIKYNVVFNIK